MKVNIQLLHFFRVTTDKMILLMFIYDIKPVGFIMKQSLCQRQRVSHWIDFHAKMPLTLTIDKLEDC